MPTDVEKAKMPDDGARLIQDAIAELGWSADAESVAERVRRLDIGLPVEDEFSVICAWLGRCELLHKLDQHQVPSRSTEKFQVPDILARFSTQTNNSPILIEVKSKQAKTLSFKPNYLQCLMAYATLVGMPLLIAWKFHNLWTLFEVKHLVKTDKNFNISIQTALRENLLGVVAGDVAYTVGAGAGVHIRIRKDELIKITPTEDGRTESWRMVVDQVTFTNYQGERIEKLDTSVQALFTSWELEETEEHSDTHIHIHSVAGQDGVQFAYTAMQRQLAFEGRQDGRPHWRALLRKGQVTASLADFSSALEAGFERKIVSHILHQRPITMPDFV